MNLPSNDNTGKILIYQNEKGDTKIDVYFEDGNIWMTQKALADLYQVNVNTINEHIKNIFAEQELFENRTIRNFRIVQNEGARSVSRDIIHYSFEMVLAIGYRIRSRIGIHFRNWATQILTEYAKKGFAMNDERLKNPKPFGVDYFDELLERIRDIRASELRVYEKIKQIYKTSIDYDSDDKRTILFFKTVQNKLHYSVHGHTAAALIAERADATKDNMGLTSFKGAKVRKSDVDTAKNYLTEQEVKGLNRIVNMYLDYAEDMAERHIPMYMNDWEQKLNDFLQFTGRKVLDNAGTISSEQAKEIADEQYKLYDEERKKNERDFDNLYKRLKKDKK